MKRIDVLILQNKQWLRILLGRRDAKASTKRFNWLFQFKKKHLISFVIEKGEPT